MIKKIKLTLLCLTISVLTVYSQSSSMLVSVRDYVYSQRPSYLLMLAGTNNMSFYKTSIDSIFINHSQVNGLSLVASSGAYNDLLGKPTIPTNTNQLVNGSGFLTSFTEVDPNVPSYAKGLTAFSVIKSSTDPLYRSVSWVPTWSDVTGKPTLFSGNYNDLTNKPTIPTVVAQYGTSYTKEFNTKVATSTSTNEYTVNISSAGFASITSIQATGYYNGATANTQPIVSIKTYSNTSVTLVVAESATTSVLIGGSVEGLTDFLKVGEIFITVKGL